MTIVDNEFNNVVGTVPVIFSKKVGLAFARRSGVVKEHLTNNYWEGEIKTEGDRVRITLPDLNAITLGDNEACPIPQATKAESLDLVIDKTKSFAIAISDKQKAQTQFKNWLEGMAAGIGEKMADARNVEIINAVFSYNASAAALTRKQYAGDADTTGEDVTKYTYANHPLAGEFGTATAGLKLTPAMAYQFLLKVKMALFQSGAIANNGTYTLSPLAEEAHEMRGVFICGPKLAEILLSCYQLTHATQAGDIVVKDGEVVRVAGLDVHIDRTIETNAVTASANGTKMPFLAGTKNAITEASQIDMTEQFRDPNCFQTILRGQQLYGFKIVHPECLVRGIIDPASETPAVADIAAVPVQDITPPADAGA